MLEMGVGVGFADPVSTTSLLRVKQYEEFSLPYFQHNVDFIKKNGGGCGLHICGGSRKLWETLNNTGIGCFGLDNIEDLEEAKERAKAAEADAIAAKLAAKQAQERLEEAQKKLKTASPEVTAFKALFDSMQGTAAKLRTMIEKIRSEDPETADKLAAALKAFGSSL